MAKLTKEEKKEHYFLKDYLRYLYLIRVPNYKWLYSLFFELPKSGPVRFYIDDFYKFFPVSMLLYEKKMLTLDPKKAEEAGIKGFMSKDAREDFEERIKRFEKPLRDDSVLKLSIDIDSPLEKSKILFEIEQILDIIINQRKEKGIKQKEDRVGGINYEIAMKKIMAWDLKKEGMNDLDIAKKIFPEDLAYHKYQNPDIIENIIENKTRDVRKYVKEVDKEIKKIEKEYIKAKNMLKK